MNLPPELARACEVLAEPRKNRKSTRRADRASKGKPGALLGMDSVLFLAACKAFGLPEPEPEYKFCSRGWKFDWYWQDRPFCPAVALEIEGGIFGKGKPCSTCKRRPVGAHTSIANMLRDVEKYNEAAILGIKVIRCIPKAVKDGTVFITLRRALGMSGAY
jgi:hypothetical protein